MHEFRIGDTWSFVGTVAITDPDGNAVRLNGYTIKSQLLRADGAVISDFVCEWIDVNIGSFRHYKRDTSHWKVGDKIFNLVFISPNNEIVSTDTQTIKLLPRATR